MARFPAKTCGYLGCTASANLERCVNGEGRYACQLHRTMRSGGYVCLACDEEEAAQASHAAAQQSLNSARWGAIASAAVGVVLAIWGFAGSPPMPLIGMAGAAIVALTGHAWTRSAGFEPARVAALPNRERMLCTVVTSGGLIAASLVGFALAMLAASSAESARRERQVETIAEGVRRGNERSRWS